jgi:hypothetical protein
MTMARTNIRQFRAALADHANQTPLMRGYRQLARGDAAAAPSLGDWPQWPAALAAAGDWGPWTGVAAT